MMAHRTSRLFIALVACCAGGFAAAPSARGQAVDEKARAEEERKAQAETVKRVLDVFEVEYKSKEESVRVTAVDHLAQVKDKKVLDRLSRVLQSAETDVVKTQAVKVIGSYLNDKNAARLLVVAMSANKKKPELVVPIVEAMGEVGDRSLVPVVLDLFRDKNNAVARAAIIASARLRDKSFVDPLLKMLRELEEEPTPSVGAPAIVNPVEEEKAKRKADLLDPVQRALADITYQSFATHKEWDSWWKKNRGTFRTDPDPKK